MKAFFTSILFFVCFLSFHPVLSQLSDAGKAYYVVIGAFTYEQNAKDFIDWTKTIGLNPIYQMNVNRKLFYVYTRKDDSWQIPVQEAEKLRQKDPKLDETWVYFGTLQPEVVTTGLSTKPSTPVEPITPVIAQLLTKHEAHHDPEAIQHDKDENSTDSAASTEPTDLEMKFLFQVMTTDGTLIQSPVEVIDLDQSSLVASYPGNEKIILKPINESGRIMIQCKVFGYRLKQITFNLNHPVDSAGITLDGNTFNVPIKLQPLTVGDITIMYNVFFFKDAGIMRPDSKYEVNALLTMMKDFPERKIIIHGHTNGDHKGKMLTIGDNKDFFALEGCHTSTGTAMELSEARARCIEEYLIVNGIDKSRMEVKAWGGKKMIHESESERAIENVRVEIEIVKE